MLKRFWALCGEFSNLITNEVVKLPKTKGSGKCKNINNTEHKNHNKITNNILIGLKVLSYLIHLILSRILYLYIKYST